MCDDVGIDFHYGTVYHFYCACNKKGERFLALAVSEQ